MSDDPRCGRCGTPLKTETVKVPIYKEEPFLAEGGIYRLGVVDRYEDREEVSDCVRCTGSY